MSKIVASISRLPRRFSLATFVLLVTIAGLIAAQVRSTLVIFELEQQFQNLAASHHLLKVSDETDIVARGLPLRLDRTLQWRVYLPEGRTYWLVIQGNEVPEEGIPQSFSQVNGRTNMLHSGIQTITVSFVPDTDKRGAWQVCLSSYSTSNLGSAGVFHAPGELVPWLETNPTLTMNKRIMEGPQVGFAANGVLRHRDQVVFPADDPAVLYRYRQVDFQDDSPVREISKSDDPGAADGFIVWIESEKAVPP